MSSFGKLAIKWGDLSDTDEQDIPVLNDPISTFEIGQSSNTVFESSTEEELEDFDIEEYDPTEDAEKENIRMSSIYFGTFGEAAVREGKIVEKKCYCLEPETLENVPSLMQDMFNWDINENNYSCIIDNIIRCFNKINEFTLFEDPIRLHFVDWYFRLRHEFLFKLTMKSLNLPSDKSDVPFSKLFGIDSKRTPDFIHVEGKNVTIIEIAVTSDLERASQTKGLESAGYQSKYEDEIKLLRAMDYMVKYHAIIFDVQNNVTTFDDEAQNMENIKVNKNLHLLLNQFSKVMSQLYPKFRDILVSTAPLLFNKHVEIESDHDDFNSYYVKHKRLLNVQYEFFKISTGIHLSVNKQWAKFALVLLRIPDRSDKYIIIFDVNKNRLFLQQNSHGLDFITIDTEYNNNNKIFFYYNLKLLVSTGLINARDSDSGVSFCIKKSFTPKVLSTDAVELITLHNPNHYNNKIRDIQYYIKLSEMYYKNQYSSTDYDPNYEDLYFDKLLEFDNLHFNNKDKFIALNKGLLSDLDMDNLDIDKLVKDLEDGLIDKNDFNSVELPIKIRHKKQPFIYPIANLNSKCFCGLSDKNTDLFNKVMIEIKDTDKFTCFVIDKYLNKEYVAYEKCNQPSDRLMSCYKLRTEQSSKITKLCKEGYKRIRALNIDTVKYMDYLTPSELSELDSLRIEVSKLGKDIAKAEKEEGVKRNIGFIRMNTKRKGSFYRNIFDEEMSHFKKKKIQSSLKGIGLQKSINDDHVSYYTTLKDLTSEMVVYKGENTDFVIDEYVADDSKLLKELKAKAIDDYKTIINSIKNSSAGFAAGFISRLGHSLLYYSQLNFNSDYIRIDNLGYNNVLLIVKGGKKIFKSKCSKLFRLIFPIHDCLVEWYQANVNYTSDFKVINIKNVNYILTPWMLWHETILTDAVSFYPRICSYITLNSDLNKSYQDNFINLSFNFYLAFHNRRKTEEMLANLRYILVATFGEFSGVQDIFSEFVSFNTDPFNAYCKLAVIINYKKYFKSLREIRKNKRGFTSNLLDKSDLTNIFTKVPIRALEDFALMIYCTFLMSKAPYQKVNERAKNLTGILKIHELYDNSVGIGTNLNRQRTKLSVTLNEDNSFDDYITELFKNDFSFDPKYISNMGVFMSSYLKSKGLRDNLHSEWIKIMSEPYDVLAKSTGLRGDYGTEDFWGQKGYMVVYKKFSQDNEYISKINELFDTNVSDHEKRKKMNELNITFAKRYLSMDEHNWKGLLFHVVDKVQWRGGREIYVMDEYTKTLQQPIEKYMGYICGKIENELISIPSDKRSWFIYHNFFEKELKLKDALKWLITLDCSKWAPKSVFSKMVIFLLNIDILPSSFICYFMNYCQKLHKKRIYFQEGEVKQLLNNIKYKDTVNKYMTKDPVTNGWYINMEYSWVMGIFNYTSSFMHASNQLYSSYIIQMSCVFNLNQETSLNMMAHSDDSGGDCIAFSRDVMQRNLTLYEVQLKACNHLLSRKKSVVSTVYFEILSTVFIGRELMPLTAKFAGGIRFTPTDKGMAQDMMQSYSKSLEILTSGGTFSQCYLAMKFYSATVFRFYCNRKPTKLDYMRPIQLLGMPDSHPIMALICGTDSDIVRILQCENGEDALLNLLMFSKAFLDLIEEPGTFNSVKFLINIKGLGKDFESVINQLGENLNKWIFKNTVIKNTGFRFMSFLNKLTDPAFVGSLTNESMTRRLSRCYWMRHNDSIKTNLGLISIKNLMVALETVQLISNKDSLGDYVNNLIYKNSENDFKKEFEVILDFCANDISVFKLINSGPIKMNMYFNNLTIKDKDIQVVRRTVKPTHLQLIKSSKPFSVNFDPAQLVCYAKDMDLKWIFTANDRLIIALRELHSYAVINEIDLNTVSNNNLLKLCQNLNEKSTKEIYLYSQIPSEIKSIKTYSSFLSFLATNSFSNKEISGLVINLGTRLTDPGYIRTQINDESYTILTLLMLLTVMIKKDKTIIADITLNPYSIIKFYGGNLNEFMNCLEKYLQQSPDYPFLSVTYEYFSKLTLNLDNNYVNAGFLKDCYFYIFIKEQKSRMDWRGEGRLLIYMCDVYIILHLFNDRVLKVTTNKLGKFDESMTKYIFDVVTQNNIILTAGKMQNPYKVNTRLAFGFDYSGDLNCGDKRDLTAAIPMIHQELGLSLISDLPFYNLQHVKNELYLLTCKDKKTYKLYSLKAKVSEYAEIARQILNPEYFANKILTLGLEDFQEFIYTELLIDLGARTYINFDDFYDNFQASRLYEVLNSVFELYPDQDPLTSNRVIKTSEIPADNSSLLRTFLIYGEEIGEPIIHFPNKISAEILSIRNEYPESFTAILRDKMTQSYKELFTLDEFKDMENDYSYIMESVEDFGDLTKKIINRMCHWGYDSFFHFLQNYQFSKTLKAFDVFVVKGFDQECSSYFSSLFPVLINKCIETFRIHSLELTTLNPYCPSISCNIEQLDRLALDYSYSAYNYIRPFACTSITHLIFLNILLTLLQSIEFCVSLENNLKGITILENLPIEFNYREQICAVVNSLYFHWLSINKISNVKLDLNIKLQRLPVEVPYPSKLANNIIEKKFKTYHHGLFSPELLPKFQTRDSVKVGKTVFKIANRIGKLSDKDLPLNEFYKFKRPVRPIVYNSLKDDLLYELEMEDDEEAVSELIENFDEEKCLVTSNVIIDQVKYREVKAIITWIFKPDGMASLDKTIERLIQTDENVVLISPYLYKNIFDAYNSYLKIITLDIFGTNESDSPLFAHIKCNEELTVEFWNKYLPGEQLNEHFPSEILKLSYDVISDNGKTVRYVNLGSILTIEDLVKEQEVSETKDVPVTIEEEVEELTQSLDVMLEDNNISKDTYEKLNMMSTKLQQTNDPDFFQHMMSKYVKAELLDPIINNYINTKLTKQEYVYMYQAPEFFGLSHAIDLPSDKHIKDEKIRAELNSLNQKILPLITSSTLTISNKMFNYLKKQIILYEAFIKNSNLKIESKTFFIGILKMLLSDARLVVSDEHDDIWNDLIIKATTKIVDDEPPPDSGLRFPKLKIGSRLKYKPSGFM